MNFKRDPGFRRDDNDVSYLAYELNPLRAKELVLAFLKLYPRGCVHAHVHCRLICRASCAAACQRI